MKTQNESKTTLFVDLDGTFTKADLLTESFLIALKQNPLIVFLCIFWLLKGKAFLKFKLASTVELDVSILPLNQEFFAFLGEEKEKGREIVLATAASQKFAKSILCEYPLFDDYIASDETCNLSGENKLNKIRQVSPSFDYAGNALIDFKIFAHAHSSYLVNPSKNARKQAIKQPVSRTFDTENNSTIDWIKQLRLHQWLKNVLVFVPLVVSSSFFDLPLVINAVLAFIAFSLLASSTYIFNDLMDLQSDRQHPRKKFRPLASGNISIVRGVIIGVLAAGASLCIAAYVGLEFTIALLIYLFTTLFYSLKLKSYIGIDVITLALLYTIRILAGAAAIDVIVSFWLLAFSIFIFLSLALVKRCSELVSLESEGGKQVKGRDYRTSDYDIILSFGTSAALLSVLMFCFYINNNVLTDQYQQPTLLWLIVPLLVYWLMRMWIKTHRGEMHDDPIVFSVKDRGSNVVLLISTFITLSAQVL